jgi:hypothetical protein
VYTFVLRRFCVCIRARDQQQQMASLLQRQPVRWSRVSTQLRTTYNTIKETADRRCRIYRHEECYEKQSRLCENRYAGRALLESFEGALKYFFEHSGVELGDIQEPMLETMRAAYLPVMFKYDVLENLQFLMDRFLVARLNPSAGLICPRRSGKTVVMAIMTAVIAVSQPEGNVIIYNLTAMQAEEFITQTMYVYFSEVLFLLFFRGIIFIIILFFFVIFSI